MTQVDISKNFKYKMEKLKYFVLCYICIAQKNLRFQNYFSKIFLYLIVECLLVRGRRPGGEADLKRLMKSQVILSHIDGRQ